MTAVPPKPISSSLTLCKHCGDPAGQQPIVYDEHKFCCQGCVTVYSILNENNLCDFYSIDTKAGFSQKNIDSDNGLDYLNESQIIEKLVSRLTDEVSMVQLYIPQMHCSSCIWLLEKLYKINSAIISSTVDFMNKEIEIRYKHKEISLFEVVKTLQSIGYKPIIDAEHKKESYDASSLLKIGVAGFAFGNIMLFSFPEYLGLKDSEFRMWFGYISILLVLPSLLYSAKEYFVQALQSIRYKNININVPLALGMLSMFGISVYDIIFKNGSGYLDSLAGLIFFLLLGKWYQHKSYNFLSFDRSYKSYFPISINKWVNGGLHNVSIEKIEIGDLLQIKYNQILPCDGILKDNEAFVDYSFVTGESNPVHIYKSANIYAGGRLTSGAVTIQAIKKVNNSHLVSLWNNPVFDKNKIDQKTINDKISAYFSIAIIIIAIIGFGKWLPHSLEKAVLTFASVLIIACPCAIAITRPFMYGNLLRILAKKGIYIRNSKVLEIIGEIKNIVFDKTGTITHGSQSKIVEKNIFLTDLEKKYVSTITAQSTHPLSMNIHTYLGTNDDKFLIEQYIEKPGQGIEAICEGHTIRLGSASFVGVKPEINNSTKVYVMIDGFARGYFEIENVYRPNLSPIINELKESNKILSILSGDNDHEKENLYAIFGKDTSIHFQQSPQQKLAHIETLQKQSKTCMIGDGLNDAGALKASDVGIVISENGNHFTPNCDVIFEASQFNNLGSFFKLCSKGQFIIYMAYGFALLYNIIGLSYALQGKLSPVVAAILMPASSLSIVLFTTISSKIICDKIMKG